jgi:hypothetical protein
LLFIVQLTPGDSVFEATFPLAEPADNATWFTLFSSNDQLYGGKGPGGYDPDERTFALNAPELIAFIEQPAAESSVIGVTR